MYSPGDLVRVIPSEQAWLGLDDRVFEVSDSPSDNLVYLKGPDGIIPILKEWLEPAFCL